MVINQGNMFYFFVQKTTLPCTQFILHIAMLLYGKNRLGGVIFCLRL
jgi:hypothetical protein